MCRFVCCVFGCLYACLCVIVCVFVCLLRCVCDCACVGLWSSVDSWVLRVRRCVCVVCVTAFVCEFVSLFV